MDTYSTSRHNDSPFLCGVPSLLWAYPSNRRCRSHRPDAPNSAPPLPSSDCPSHTGSAPLQRHPNTTSAPGSQPGAPPPRPGSTAPLDHCLRSCTPAALAGSSDPTVHTLLPPSKSPKSPPPSPATAPRIIPPACPFPPPARADNAPDDSPACSTPRSSASPLQIPSPPRPDSVPPELQTTRGDSNLAGNLLLCR